MLEHDAIALAKLTPASGWGALPEPEVNVAKTDDYFQVKFAKAELEARLRRAYRQLAEGFPRLSHETHQQWADRMSGPALQLLHTIRVAYLNLEAL